MFRGSSFHTIDEKGRLVVPARFRDLIRAGGGDGIMVTQLDGCLKAYTLDEWSRVEHRILNMPIKNESMRRFRRVFIGDAASCPCDKQGRVLIPPALRQYVEIERDIALVGVLDHFEIWARHHWDQQHTALEEDMKQEDVRNEIAKLGL